VPASRLDGVFTHMGKANLPENAALAKQCHPFSLTSIATEWSFLTQKNFKGFFNIGGRLIAAR